MKSTLTDNEELLTSHPPIVSRDEWQHALDQLLVKEKAATRAHDALAAERRRLPMMKVERDYVFDGPNGQVRCRDLDREGWEAGCAHHILRYGDVSCQSEGDMSEKTRRNR